MFSAFQLDCLSEMGVQRYISRSQISPYAVIYLADKDGFIEQRNQQLLSNILSALGWLKQDLDIYQIKSLENLDYFRYLLQSRISRQQGLWFWEGALPEQLNEGNHTDLVLLPSLHQLHADLGLKKHVWQKIKHLKS